MTPIQFHECKGVEDGRTLRRNHGIDENFVDTATDDEYWLSAPRRDQTDCRYSNLAPLLGRETG